MTRVALLKKHILIKLVLDLILFSILLQIFGMKKCQQVYN